MDIKTLIPNNPTSIALCATIFLITMYLTYIYLNKDSEDKDKINYTYLIYSIIPSILVAILINYLFNRYKSSNCSDRLTDDFYS